MAGTLWFNSKCKANVVFKELNGKYSKVVEAKPEEKRTMTRRETTRRKTTRRKTIRKRRRRKTTKRTRNNVGYASSFTTVFLN